MVVFQDSLRLLIKLGIGAIDDFELNTGINDNEDDPDVIERNNYILGYLPVTTQWNYAVGVNWTHFKDKSFQNFVLSRNHLNNESIKYKDNIEETQNLLQNYKSEEIETKFRFENTVRNNGWKINFGTGIEAVTYKNKTYQKIIFQNIEDTLNFNSELNFIKSSLFGQVSKKLMNNKLVASLGIRTDNNSYSKQMANPLKQLSPRFSLAYALNEKSSLNFNVGQYFQLPAYTVMGYRNSSNELINKNNSITYIIINT